MTAVMIELLAVIGALWSISYGLSWVMTLLKRRRRRNRKVGSVLAGPLTYTWFC